MPTKAEVPVWSSLKKEMMEKKMNIIRLQNTEDL